MCEAIIKAAKSKFPEYFAVAAEMEQRALSTCYFAPALVPGVLQTPDFMRALFGTARPRVAPEEVERRVTARLERASSSTRRRCVSRSAVTR